MSRTMSQLGQPLQPFQGSIQMGQSTMVISINQQGKQVIVSVVWKSAVEIKDIDRI